MFQPLLPSSLHLCGGGSETNQHIPDRTLGGKPIYWVCFWGLAGDNLCSTNTKLVWGQSLSFYQASCSPIGKSPDFFRSDLSEADTQALTGNTEDLDVERISKRSKNVLREGGIYCCVISE